jgi:hypothetical protein
VLEVSEHPLYSCPVSVRRLLAVLAQPMRYECDGQVGKAVELLEHIVAVEAKVLVEEHPDRLASQYELARASAVVRSFTKA